MKERPILFSAPMVRALLDENKTQTRRIVKPQPDREASLGFVIPQPNAKGSCAHFHHVDKAGIHSHELTVHCPHGMPRDRLWVKENGVISKLAACDDKPGLFRHDVPETPEVGRYWVESTRAPGASYSVVGCSREAALLRPSAKVCASMFMPRWASRILLEITAIRVERLQDISIQDTHAEGVGIQCDSPMAVMEYSLLWESINGAGSWDANLWVWVIEFRNISQDFNLKEKANEKA